MASADADADAASELERLLSEPAAKAVVRAFMRITPSLAILVRAPDLKVLFCSAFGARLIGQPIEALQGVPFETYESLVRVFWPDGRPVERDERVIVRAARGETIAGQEGWLLDTRGERVPLLCNGAPIQNAEGEVVGGVMTCLDIRTQKALEAELRVAYRELTHRVKNHLQIMSGLIALEAREPGLTAAELAERNQARLKMLAAIYDQMTQAEAGQRIAAHAFVDLVCRPYRSSNVAVQVRVEPDDLTLSVDQAAPVGILLNEAVCNSYKHAFPGRNGTVWVSLEREPPDGLALEVADDGVGFPAAAPPDRSHGLTLMRIQAEKMQGSFTVGVRTGGGAVVRSVIPEEG